MHFPGLDKNIGNVDDTLQSKSERIITLKRKELFIDSGPHFVGALRQRKALDVKYVFSQT